MKSNAVSEIILNTLKHEFRDASEARLLELAGQLQQAERAGLDRGSAVTLPPVARQKLSKAVLRALRSPGPGSGQAHSSARLSGGDGGVGHVQEGDGLGQFTEGHRFIQH